MSSCLVPTQSNKFLPDAGAGSHKNCHKVCGWPGQEECWLYLGSVGKGFWLFWARPKLWSSPAVLAQLQQVRPQATQMGKKYWEVAEISDGFRWLWRS